MHWSARLKRLGSRSAAGGWVAIAPGLLRIGRRLIERFVELIGYAGDVQYVGKGLGLSLSDYIFALLAAVGIAWLIYVVLRSPWTVKPQMASDGARVVVTNRDETVTLSGAIRIRRLDRPSQTTVFGHSVTNPFQNSLYWEDVENSKPKSEWPYFAPQGKDVTLLRGGSAAIRISTNLQTGDIMFKSGEFRTCGSWNAGDKPTFLVDIDLKAPSPYGSEFHRFVVETDGAKCTNIRWASDDDTKVL